MRDSKTDRRLHQAGAGGRQYGRILMLASVAGAGVLLLVSAAIALAGERVDFVDAKGRRTGYAIVDR